MQKILAFLSSVFSFSTLLVSPGFSANIETKDTLTLSNSFDPLRSSLRSSHNTLDFSQVQLSISSSSIPFVGECEDEEAPVVIPVEEISDRKMPGNLISEINVTRTLDSKSKEILDKRVAMYKMAQGEIQQLLDAIHIKKHSASRDVPFLQRFFLSGKEFLIPAHLIADHFMGIKTKEDGALALLRLGSTTLNPQLFYEREDFHRKEREGFAADCFYVVADYCYRQISRLLNDLKLLPSHRKHSESAYAQTIEGRKHSLESLASLAQISKWALYRLDYSDWRYNVVYENVLSLTHNVKHFYTSTVTNIPEWSDLLVHYGFVGKLASHIVTSLKTDVLENDLLHHLLKTGVEMINGSIIPEAPVFLYWKDGDQLTQMTQKNLQEIVFAILELSNEQYYFKTVPEYKAVYNNINSILAAIEATHTIKKEAYEKDNDDNYLSDDQSV